MSDSADPDVGDIFAGCFITAFVVAPLATWISRGHAENIWIGAVAISAAAFAAVTAWRLFPV